MTMYEDNRRFQAIGREWFRDDPVSEQPSSTRDQLRSWLLPVVALCVGAVLLMTGLLAATEGSIAIGVVVTLLGLAAVVIPVALVARR